jgi:hypothetical protein
MKLVVELREGGRAGVERLILDEPKSRQKCVGLSSALCGGRAGILVCHGHEYSSAGTSSA